MIFARLTCDLNSDLAVINGPRKFKNPTSWQVFFLVVPFNKITLFSKDLITFISFISLFAGVIPETLLDVKCFIKLTYSFINIFCWFSSLF